MKRSILRRAASAVAVSALAFTGVAVAGAAPAQAAVCNTAVALTVYQPTNTYGDYNRVSADANSSCDNGPFGGSTILQRYNGSSWVTVASDDISFVTYSGAGRFNQSATFRAWYTGGTGATNSYTASPVATTTVRVIRKIKVSDRSVRGGVKGTFKIKPKASIKKLKVKFQVKKGNKWRKYKAVRANKKGVATAIFKASRKGIKYRMILPGKRGFAKSTHGPFTATVRYYRPQMR